MGKLLKTLRDLDALLSFVINWSWTSGSASVSPSQVKGCVFGAGGVCDLLTRVPGWNRQIARLLFSTLHKPDVIPALNCKPGTSRVEAGESEAEGHPQPHAEFKFSLCYIRPCPNK